MLEILISDEQQEVRELARRIAAEVLDPIAGQADDTGRIPDVAWRRLIDTGLSEVPDTPTALMVAEELGRGDVAIAHSATTIGTASLLLSSLPGTVAPETVAIYEGFGRAPSEYETTIAATADGQWRVSGVKVAVPLVAGARRIAVFGRDAVTGRARVVVVSADDAGVDIRPLPAHGYLALAAAALRTVRLDVIVDADRLVGGAAADPVELARFGARLRLLPAAVAVGCAARATEYAAVYASDRVAFGQPIAAFQGVSFMLAEAVIQIEACRLDLWSVAEEIDSGDPGAAERHVTRSVNYSCATAAAITRDAVQVLGGHGFIRDHPVERWYRATAMLSALDFDPTCSGFAPAL
jgi:hypothetical protein